MSRRKLVAVGEITHSLKAKPIQPGKTFTAENHEQLVAIGVAKYFVEPPEIVDSDTAGEGGGASGSGGEPGAGEGNTGAGNTGEPGTGGESSKA